MVTKTIPSRPALVFRTETTLSNAPSFAGKIAKELFATAAAAGVLPTGPICWIYSGADGKPETVFILEIALPVDRQPDSETKFPFKVLAPFNCAAFELNGPWTELTRVYQEAMPAVMQSGREYTGICREEYINMDFNEPANNRTEVQVGIQ